MKIIRNMTKHPQKIAGFLKNDESFQPFSVVWRIYPENPTQSPGKISAHMCMQIGGGN